MPQSDSDLLRVGGRAFVVGKGWRSIEAITVALRPSVDPAAEEYGAGVEAVERAVPHVLTLDDGSWAYGVQISDVEAA